MTTAATTVEERLALLEHELSRLKAVDLIQNLMGRYTVNHTPATMHRAVHFFALDRPDVSAEMGDRGVFFGEEGIRALFQGEFPMEPVGNLLLHYLATPMIEVAGDGQTARGVWRSPGVEAVRRGPDVPPVPLWSFGAYAADFVRTGTGWKILHLRWLRTIKCTFADGWVDDLSMTFGGPVADQPYIAPNTYHNPYTPDSTQEPVPPCPPAYDTYNGPQWAVTPMPVP